MSRMVRQWHRWIGIVFVFTVVANFVAMAFGQPPAVITYAPLLPLALMVVSGLYLFALPHFRKLRAKDGSG